MKRYGKFNLTKNKKQKVENNAKNITEIRDDSIPCVVMARLRAFPTYQLLDDRNNE